MEKIIFFSFVISLLFSGFKVAENKILNDSMKPLKEIVRDFFILFLCSFITLYFLFYFEKNIDELLNIVTEQKEKIISSSIGAKAFTEPPGF